MADSDKNILITPNRGATSQPSVVFTGQGNDPITVRVLDGTTGIGITAGGALSFEGSAGQLFSVVNRLGTGSIFSVNDISGIPSIDVDANGTIEFAPFTGYVAIGLTLPTEKLHVLGNVLTSGRISAIGGLSASGGLGVTGGATFNGDVRVNLANTLSVENINSFTQINIDNKASGARVQIGPSAQGNDTHLFIRDAVSALNISNPFGDILIGDPNLVDSGAYITYNASAGALNGNDTNEIIGFSALRAGIITATSGLSASGNIRIKGATFEVSGTAPLYSARAWVNFDGSGTVSIRNSQNVSSITDFGVGNYRINYTTAMGATSYSLTGTARRTTATNDSNISLSLVAGSTALGTTYGRIFTGSPTTSGAQDTNFVMVVIHA